MWLSFEERMVPIARKNLLSDKVRVLVSVGGVTFAVVLVLVVWSLYQGYYRGTGAFVERMPIDIWVSQVGSSGTLLSSILPESTGQQISSLPGVQKVVPMNRQFVRLDHNSDDIDMIVLAFALPADASQSYKVPIPSPGGIVLDKATARKYGLQIGDSVGIRGKQLTVTGVSSSMIVGLTGVAIISWQDGQSMLSPSGAVSSWMVTVKPSASVAQVIGSVDAQVPGVEAVPNRVFAAETRHLISGHFLPIITVLVFVSFLIGSAVVGITIYTATTERLSEFGVLKAIGAPMAVLNRVVVEQSALVCAAGFLVGIPATILVNHVAARIVPDFITQLRWQDSLLALGVVLGMAVVAALIPIRRLAKLDPSDIFRT